MWLRCIGRSGTGSGLGSDTQSRSPPIGVCTSFDNPHESTTPGAFVQWLAFNGPPTVLAFSHLLPLARKSLANAELTMS
jgi:hypothetical protein